MQASPTRAQNPAPPVLFNPTNKPPGELDLLNSCIIRELLAIPSAVLDRPVFSKLNRYLKTYKGYRIDEDLND